MPGARSPTILSPSASSAFSTTLAKENSTNMSNGTNTMVLHRRRLGRMLDLLTRVRQSRHAPVSATATVCRANLKASIRDKSAPAYSLRFVSFAHQTCSNLLVPTSTELDPMPRMLIPSLPLTIPSSLSLILLYLVDVYYARTNYYLTVFIHFHGKVTTPSVFKLCLMSEVRFPFKQTARSMRMK